MSRWIRVQTSIFDHEVFASEPFSEREAWVWLIAKAAWKDTKHRIGHRIVDVPSGSVFLTLREMQAVWRWKSDKRVRSFLLMLEREGMIETKSDAGKTQVTICNYSRYQEAGRTEDAAGTHGGRTADALKTPVNQNTISEAKASSRREIEREFNETFWPAYPHKRGKPGAIKAFHSARKRADLATIMAGVHRYADERAGQDAKFTKYPQGWLAGDHWSDEPQPSHNATAPPQPREPRNAGERALMKLQNGHHHEPPSPPDRHLDPGDGRRQIEGTGLARRFAGSTISGP